MLIFPRTVHQILTKVMRFNHGVYITNFLITLTNALLTMHRCDLTGQVPHTLTQHQQQHHLSLNREGRWGTTDDFATSFFLFSLVSTAFWDLANSRPVHSLILSSHLFLCLPCLLPRLTVLCKMVLARPGERENDHTTAVCVSLRWSGGLRVVRLSAGSWRGLPRW